MALPQLPAHVVHKLGQHSRVIQEFLSTREYAKEGVSAFDTPSFVHTVYPLFKVHSADFFSNIFFLSRSAYALGKKFLCPLSRHFLHMGSPKIFNFWGERRHKSPNAASDILCDLVAERECPLTPFA